jgi:hypothetical protein
MIENKKTLEILHRENLTKLQRHEEKIHELEESIKDLENKEKLAQSAEERVKYLDTKIEVRDELESLKNSLDLSEYHMKTAEIMDQYYNLEQPVGKSRSIMDLFKKDEDDNNNGGRKNAGSLLNTYMSIVDPDSQVIKKTSREKKQQIKHKCEECGSNEVCVMNTEGYILCMDCNMVKRFIVDHDKPSYKDPPKEVIYNCYKRSNHLNECINQIQGKQRTDIPEEVIDHILYELKKQRITNVAKLKTDFMFKLLKKINLSSYYDHIPYIIHILNGCVNPVVDPAIEERVHDMFRQVHEVFVKHIPSTRTNMLSYPYLLHKFFQLLEQDHLLKNVRLLKNTDKLKEQDEIWMKICKDCQWQFIPSTIY